jgi:hypothetical protein
MSNLPQTTKADLSLEDFIFQQMSVSELLTFKILQNYHKIVLIKFLSIFFLFLSSPVLKSSGLVGLLFTSLTLSYIHFRFGSIVFAIILSLVLVFVLFYISFLVF